MKTSGTTSSQSSKQRENVPKKGSAAPTGALRQAVENQGTSPYKFAALCFGLPLALILILPLFLDRCLP